VFFEFFVVFVVQRTLLRLNGHQFSILPICVHPCSSVAYFPASV
jgi:hypothetical protein